MRPMSPRGFRDVLTDEAVARETIAGAMSGALDGWGYDPVATPAVEMYATVDAAAGSLEGIAFRLVDSDGTLLALRPDMTIPIARIAATRMAQVPRPLRLRYRADVFREHESLRGQAREFEQVGIELLGVGGSWADAEVVTVLVDALEAVGLPRFTVALGSVRVLGAPLATSGMVPEWSAQVLDAAHRSNFVELDRLSRIADCPEAVGEAVRVLPRTRGGESAITRAVALLDACGCAGALDSLRATWDLLQAAGVGERVVVDFGIVRSFDYYSDLVVEAYAPGVGLPLGGGGRYDGVLGSLGREEPAAGFAIGVERVLIALAEQGIEIVPDRTAREIRVAGASAFAEARAARAAGERVTLVEEVPS